MEYQYRFTVFTACYNSEKFIHRVFESLETQTFRDFEWLVINDASTDNTLNILHEYSKRATFPMRILTNPVNKMLYYNFNIGFEEAKGEFMVFAGHDDRYDADMLETFYKVWKQYGNDKIARISGLCRDQFCNLVGNKYPKDILISNYFTIFEKYIYQQEKGGCTRTEILKEHPFNLETDRIGETFLWEAISLKYDTIFINKIFRTYYREPENLNALTKVPRSRNARYIYASYLDWVNIYLHQYSYSIKFKIRYHFALIFYGIIKKESLITIVKDIHHFASKLIAILMYPFALMLKIYFQITSKL